MNGEMTNYYFLKDVIKHIPIEIEKELTYDDALLFNFANFLNVPKFYLIYNIFKKDKYELDKKFDEDFDTFFLECTISLHQLNDYKRLLFLYSILAIHNFKTNLTEYFNLVKGDLDICECYNMLDMYLANKNDIDLTTTSLYSLFGDTFNYYDYVEDLIHQPLIRCYKFMGSMGYFKKSYKRFYHYAKKNCVGDWKKGFYKMHDSMFGKGKPKKKYFLYTKDINMDILNLKRNEFETDNGIVSSSYMDIWNQSLTKTLNQIQALNDYLFAKNEKNFRKVFNISLEKKL